jgi:hypothetical protein
MPARVGRFYIAPIFSFAMGAYDEDANLNSFDGNVQVFNLGFALEYGVNDWITAAVQWVPGWTPWSDISAASGFDNSNTNGVADIFAGAKIQLLGPRAPFRSQDFRFAVAPGVIIPLPGPDFERELTRASQGSEATLSAMDRHVFGLGGRIFFDWVINRNFFINLFNETIFFPLKQDLNKSGPTFFGAKAIMAQTPEIQAMLGPATPLLMDIEGEINHKYQLTFEIEPVFTTSVANGITFSAGLPITYSFTPAPDYSFSFPAALAPAAPGLEPILLGALNAEPQHSVRLTPNIGFFFMNLPLPMEFKFNYSFPVWGQNVMATHNAVLQIRAYFAIGR